MYALRLDADTAASELTAHLIRWDDTFDWSHIQKELDATSTVVQLTSPTDKDHGIDIWCDDEALLKDNMPKFDFVWGDSWEYPLAGMHFLLLGFDIEGATHGLTHAQLQDIQRNLKYAFIGNTKE